MTLTDLLVKEVPFVWSSACQKVFDKPNEVILSEVVLHMADINTPFVLKMDTSGHTVGTVLELHNQDSEFRTFAFYSRKLAP